MNSAQTIVVAGLWGTAVLALAIGVYSWRRRSMGEWAVSFAVLAFAIAFWSFAYGLEVAAETQVAKLFWAKIEYVGIVTVPVAWFVFALQYTNRAGWLTRRWLLALCISPALTLLFVFTNEAHGLIWTEIGMDSSGPIPVLATTHGVWFWIHSAYSYILIIAGAILLIQAFARYPRAYRRQNASLVAGALLPLVANVIFLSGVLPLPHLDYTTFSFAICCLLIANAIFRYRLFELVPVARRTAVDNMRDGLIVLDLQNRILDINPAALNLFQRPATEMVGYPLYQFLQDQAYILDSFRDITDMETEIDVNTPDRLRTFALQISPLHDGRDHLSGRMITFHDITARKEAEQALARARDEALAASRFKSELLARVSHELRTPLNVILGYTEMLQEGIFGPLTPAQWEPTQKIVASTDFLARQVNELLDLARLEVGQLQVNIREMSVADVVRDVHEKMVVLADAKGIQLLSQVQDNVPAIVMGDPNRTTQILLNLVGNAIKFSDGGVVQQQVLVADGRLLLRVSDQGIGIPAEMQETIFEPFMQVDGSLTRQRSGTGLGLAIVKQLTELMAGNITLESKVAQGSTFTICLPLVTANGEENSDTG